MRAYRGNFPMILTVAHSKGGVGKSTLVWHIAFMLISLGKSVRIADLDFQQTTYFLNEIRKSKGLEGVDVDQPQSVGELINLFENYDEDILIVDIGGFDNDINRTAISWADKVLLPISNSPTEIIGFKTFEAILEQVKNPFICMVLNNIHPKMSNFKKVLEAIGENQHIKLLDSIVRSRVAYKKILENGKAISDTSNEVAIDEIKRLCLELI